VGCDGDSFVGRFIITRKAGLFGELVAFSASWSSRSWDYVDAFWVEGELWYRQIRELRISLSLLLDTWLLTDLQWNFRCLWAYLYHSTFKSLVNFNTNNSIQVETHAMLFLLCQSDVVTMNNPKGHFYSLPHGAQQKQNKIYRASSYFIICQSLIVHAYWLGPQGRP